MTDENKLTREEMQWICNDAMNFYMGHPERAGFDDDEGRCVYATCYKDKPHVVDPNGVKCAVGRLLSEKSLQKVMHMNGSVEHMVDPIFADSDDDEYRSYPEATIVVNGREVPVKDNLDFLSKLQNIHDGSLRRTGHVQQFEMNVLYEHCGFSPSKQQAKYVVSDEEWSSFSREYVKEQVYGD